MNSRHTYIQIPTHTKLIKSSNNWGKIVTLSPFFVGTNDLVDEIDVCESPALRFAHDFRIVALLFPEEIYIQHFISLPITIPDYSVCKRVSMYDFGVWRGRERERDALKLQTCTVVLGAARFLSALLSCNGNGSLLFGIMELWVNYVKILFRGLL